MLLLLSALFHPLKISGITSEFYEMVSAVLHMLLRYCDLERVKICLSCFDGTYGITSVCYFGISWLLLSPLGNLFNCKKTG